MTMAKLASLAGVSVSTVSKAFSASDEISEEKREHIFKIAREMGCYDKYCKNICQKPVIAVICPEFQSNYYAQQLSCFEREIKNRGGIMVVSSDEFDEARREEMILYFAETLKADGMIIYGKSNSDRKYSMPIVTIGEQDIFDSVCVSGKNAIYEAIEHFAENGHKNIAFIGETLTKKKRDIFANAMEENGLKINSNYIIENTSRFQTAGYDAMNRLFELKNPPTAILAAYDEIAIGAMRSIYEHGKNIPEDISIIGMDDIRINPYLSVPLTSITSYNEDLCQIATDILFERIKSPGVYKPKKIKVSSELIKRGSVGKI